MRILINGQGNRAQVASSPVTPKPPGISGDRGGSVLKVGVLHRELGVE